MKKHLYILYSAAIFMLGGCLFVAFLLLLEFAIGYPSSTSSLALLAIPPAAFIGAVLGFALGLLYVLLGRFFKTPFLHLDGAAFVRLIGIPVLLLAFCIPLFFQIRWNINNRPRVMINKDKISSAVLTEVEQRIKEFNKAPGPQKKKGVVYEYDSKYNISYNAHSLSIEFLRTNKKFTYDFSGHDYIRNIGYFSFINDVDQKEYLVVYAKLRTTSRIIIYSIFDPQGECVYRKLDRR